MGDCDVQEEEWDTKGQLTVDGRMGNTMEFCAFKNTDGTLAIVVMNRTEADMVYELCLPNANGDKAVVLKCPPRGIQTLITDA